MQISWHGLSSFEIVTKGTSGDVTVVTDPYDNKTGLRFPRTLEADLLVSTHKGDDASNLAAVQGSPFVIENPGEYEVKDVFVFVHPAPSKDAPDNKIVRIESERMNIAHLGAIDRELTDKELEFLKNIDILMVPVGGGRVAEPKVAAAIVSQVEPRVVLPMTCAAGSLKEKFKACPDFCKELGACRKEEGNKLKMARKDLPEDDMLVMILNR